VLAADVAARRRVPETEQCLDVFRELKSRITSRNSFMLTEYAHGGDHELNGIVGPTPEQLIPSGREAVDRDKSQE